MTRLIPLATTFPWKGKTSGATTTTLGTPLSFFVACPPPVSELLPCPPEIGCAGSRSTHSDRFNPQHAIALWQAPWPEIAVCSDVVPQSSPKQISVRISPRNPQIASRDHIITYISEAVVIRNAKIDSLRVDRDQRSASEIGRTSSSVTSSEVSAPTRCALVVGSEAVVSSHTSGIVEHTAAGTAHHTVVGRTLCHSQQAGTCGRDPEGSFQPFKSQQRGIDRNA
jgi:hypothetical protein